jgi:hypothetical protein
MPSPMRQPTSFGLEVLSCILSFTALVFSQACSTVAPSAPPMARAPQATVYFDEVADWSFEAGHPAIIEAPAIEQVLQGLYINEKSRSLSSADGSKPMRAFSDEDAKYLAPLLAHALSQAQPEYVVAFRLSSSAGSGVEPTAGTVYVLDQQLHVTLTAFRGNLGYAAGTEMAAMPGTPPARRLSFERETMSQVHIADPTVALGRHGLQTVAIDYSRLEKPTDVAVASAPAALPAVASPASAPASSRKPEPMLLASTADIRMAAEPPQALQPETGDRKEQEWKEAQQAMAKKDAKIDQLRRDLESMRQQLEAKDKELRQAKSKPAAIKQEKRRSAEVTVR